MRPLVIYLFVLLSLFFPNLASAVTPMVSAGGFAHTAALKPDGTMWTWGWNGMGQLGDGTTTERHNPTLVPGLTGVIAVATGSMHTVALKADGTVMTWGYNNDGELGHDAYINNFYSPAIVPDLTNVAAVAAGANHTVALKSDGTVVAWGYNGYGQQGDGTYAIHWSPVAVLDLTGIIAVGAGANHSMALKSDGTVWTWGDNTYGQLGDGATVSLSQRPVQVPGLTGVIAIGVGYYNNLALKSDGTVVAWGANQYGEVGDGTTTQRNSPVAVSGLTGVTAVASGKENSVVLKSDGTVMTWGANQNGELGDGTTTNRYSPATIQGLTGVASLSMDGGSGSHHAVVKTDGSIMAWGSNTYGQLGDGTTTDSYSPVLLTGLQLTLLNSQTIGAISFTPTTLSVGSASTASATATSGLAVNFSSTTPATCSVSGSIVTGIAPGTCIIAADQAGNTSYSAATQVTQSITIDKANQTLSFGTAPTIVMGGTGTVSATATSGLAVSFSSTTPGVCSISGNIVTGIAAGTCTITADQAGSTNYNSATTATQSFIIKSNQTVSFGSAPSLAVGGTGTVSATATSSLAVSYSSATPGVCSISGNTITALAAGTCTIAANQAGDANYNAATTVTQSFAISKANQTVSFGGSPTITVNGTGTVSATATSSLAVSYSSTTPGVCSVSGGIVTGIAAGTCTIAANQPGDTNYNAATTVTQSFTISKNNQAINFSGVSPVALGGSANMYATASSSLAVSYSSMTPNICSISGSVATGNAAGTCTIAADQPGNASFNAASQMTQSFSVIAQAAYSGNYSGTLSGGNGGTWAAAVTPSGAVTLSAYSSALGAFLGTGQVGLDGSLGITASTGSILSGWINLFTGAFWGNWSNAILGLSGAFTGGVVDTTVLNPLIGVWQGQINDGAIWNRTVVMNRDLTWSMSVIAADGTARSCLSFGIYSYNASAATLTVGSSLATGNGVTCSNAANSVLSIPFSSISSNGLTLPLPSGVISSTPLAMISSNPSGAGSITEFALPSANSTPFGITTGPDGNVWFTEGAGNKIGRITVDGVITEYPIPTADSAPQCIVSGPDGNLWFVEGNGNKIGKITTAGVITEFNNTAGGWPQCLTLGPDNNLWFADQGPIGNGATSGNGSIGRITTAGVITKFSVPVSNSEPNFITTGPDGALWFTYGNDQNIGINKIGRITTAGVVTDFPIPTANSGPMFIATGADGALWFTESNASKIGKITTNGTITEYALPANTNPLGLVAGPDGALWFTETGVWTSGGFVGGGQKIGRITMSGAISEFAIPTTTPRPGAITLGPDGALWFGEINGNKIGRLTLANSANGGTTLNLVPNWNLLGNSVSTSLNVGTMFGDTTKISTVWKWLPATGKWAFYAPSMTSADLATYAANKGYDVLATINSGEGFWVNARTAFTAQLPAGNAISSNTFTDQSAPLNNNLPKGWSLIAVGGAPSPRSFANAIAITQPVAPAVAATSITTLWAWDSGLSNWYFYAPSLDNNNGLASYITSKGYLNFGVKALDPTTGFWVNKP